MIDCFDEETEALLRKVYIDLLEKSEPLGYEFEKVLHDNFWDLLIKDSPEGPP